MHEELRQLNDDQREIFSQMSAHSQLLNMFNIMVDSSKYRPVDMNEADGDENWYDRSGLDLTIASGVKNSVLEKLGEEVSPATFILKPSFLNPSSPYAISFPK